jgi:hypothetical protein
MLVTSGFGVYGSSQNLIAGFLPALAYLIIADFFWKTVQISYLYRFFLALFKMWDKVI